LSYFSFRELPELVFWLSRSSFSLVSFSSSRLRFSASSFASEMILFGLSTMSFLASPWLDLDPVPGVLPEPVPVVAGFSAEEEEVLFLSLSVSSTIIGDSAVPTVVLSDFRLGDLSAELEANLS
jgi:hypothetical protein